MNQPKMLEPVHIKNPHDMVSLAQEMRQRAMELPQREKPKYPKTQTELMKQCVEDKDAYIEAGLNRLAVFHTPRMELPVSLALTFDQQENPHEWHLSMVMPGPAPMTWLVVPEHLAKVIAIYLLGPGFREVAREGMMIKEIRHFKKVAE